MAWNKYYVFVKNPGVESVEKALEVLGLGHYEGSETVTLYDTNKPETLFAGIYNDSLLLVDPELPFDFFKDSPSAVEQRFISAFPNCEIAAIVENSTVDLFGFAVLDSGKRIRIKDGCDGELYHDMGEPLSEEEEVLQETIFSDEELEEMQENGMSLEQRQEMIAFEASWRVPDLITRRYLGKPVSTIDGGQVMLTRFLKKKS